jgi:hypothetical protein
MFPFLWSYRGTYFLTSIDLVLVIFSFLDNHRVECLKPGKESSTVRDNFSHYFVKSLCAVICLVLASKHRKSFGSDLQNPEFLHVIVVKVQHQISISFFVNLELDVLLDATHLWNDFIHGKQRKTKIAPQQNFCNSVVSIQPSKVILCKVKN